MNTFHLTFTKYGNFGRNYDRAAWLEDADLDDGADLIGDPDEYAEHYCMCSVAHGIEEIDSNQCDCCGKDIA